MALYTVSEIHITCVHLNWKNNKSLILNLVVYSILSHLVGVIIACFK